MYRHCGGFFTEQFILLDYLFFLVIDDQVLLPCKGDYFLNIFQQEGETDSALKRWAEHLR